MKKVLRPFAVTILTIVFAGQATIFGETTIVQRQSVAAFDVFAGVGPAADRQRIAPPIFTAPTGDIELVNEYDAFAAFDNGTIAGTANSHGAMTHLNSIDQTADVLAIEFLNIGEGMIETEGDGGAVSSTNAFLQFRFTITEETPFRFRLNIDPLLGRSETEISFNSTSMPLVLVDMDAAGFVLDEGVLPAGDYRVNIFTRGFATSANGEPQNDPPYEYGLNFSLRVGEVLPGDLNLDGVVNLLDVGNFVESLSTGAFRFEGDFNGDSIINLLDVTGFIAALSGG